jgi:serine/threonine protein kinase
LSDQPEDAWLIALGNDVSDGKTVDWELADRRAADPEAKALLGNLKRLEAVIQAHRSSGGSGGAASRPVASPTTHWHHLVLFEAVGSGAFGTVYRAWDTKLDREVALKLLPAGGSSARSPLSEARNLARVRHPNIVTVYGAEQADNQVGIWMEFIQGQTLAEMVRERGPMSAREVVGIGLDLCRALSALQAASLLHRDIKAHNVMREVGGRIVLMDFSGAWTSQPNEAPANVSGTPLYMAPELFESRPPSVASDIYSLGVLLFYLLSGRVPVEGASVSELKAAHARGVRVLLRDLRPELPEAVVQVIERAIEHKAEDRYQTGGELEHALQGTFGAYAPPVSEPPAPPVAEPVRARQLSKWATVAAAVVALVGLAAFLPASWLRSEPKIERLTVRFAIDLPHNTGSWPRISPDGKRVVFGSAAAGEPVLWMRKLDAVEGRPIPYTSARESPFWSPDSRFLAFFDKGKLKKIEVDGDHQPEPLTDVPRANGADWGSSDVILFARDEGLFRIAPDGNGERPVTTLNREHGEVRHGWPEFLPDGRSFIFLVRSTQPDRTGMYVGSLDSPDIKRIGNDYSRAVYSRDGYLLFARDGSLFAQPFDLRAKELKGTAQQIAPHVKYHPGSDGAFDVSDNGVLIFRELEDLPVTRVQILDDTGARLGPIAPIGAYRHPRFSPDGQRVVVESQEVGNLNSDLVMFDLARGGTSRLTRNESPDVAPTWSPDGQSIAFSSKRSTRYDVYIKNVNDSSPEQLVAGMEGDKFVEDWSGDSLIVSIQRMGLMTMPLNNRRAQPTLIRPTASVERWLAEVSPDGKWIAYNSVDADEREVFVESLQGSGTRPRKQVSADGGYEPHWRHDGRELYYITSDGQIAAVTVTPDGDTLRLDKPRKLFRVIVPGLGTTSNFHPAPDGKRFVVNTLLGYPPVPPVHIVVNWQQLLSR